MARLQRVGGTSHKNLVEMRHCCWAHEMMLVFSFYELGDLQNVLQDERLPGADVHWAANGVLSNLALGIVSGMRFLHENEDESGDPRPV